MKLGLSATARRRDRLEETACYRVGRLLVSVSARQVSALQMHQEILLRLTAVRAVWGFCEHLKSQRATALLTPMLPLVTESLLNLAVMFSNEVLGLVLETLAVVLAVSILFLLIFQSPLPTGGMGFPSPRVFLKIELRAADRSTRTSRRRASPR